MTYFKAIFITFLAFTALPTFSQITKGNYSVAGNFGLLANLQKSSPFNDFRTSAFINPSVGKFITDKWFVGVQPNLYASMTRFGVEKFSTASQSTSKSTYQILGLGITSRYYFADDKKTRFFGLMGLGVSQSWYVADNIFSNDATSKGTGIQYEVGFGADIFLNPEVALEPTLSYTGYQSHYEQTGFGGSNPVNRKENLLALTIKFNNFVNFSTKTDSKETPQYIGKNRQIAGGRADFSHVKSSTEKSTYYTLNPQFGQFITHHILLKGALTVVGDVDISENTTVNTALAARYYWCIHKRFFMYPELSVNYFALANSQFLNGSVSFPNIFTTGLTIGGSYFLSKNLAIDMTFSQTQLSFRESTDQCLSTSLGIGTIGLLYFIK